MPPLYVVQQGAKLRIRSRRLQIEKEKDGEISILSKVPIGHVSQVILFGNIGITTPAISCLLNRSIEVVFLSQRGEYRGHLTNGLTPHVPLRRTQYAALGDTDFTLQIAKGFVRAKLQHQRALLQRHNRAKKEEVIQTSIERINSSLKRINNKTRLSSLRGLEGAASAAYFKGFKRLFAENWHFDKRLRRPPPDPVNAMLSFGYTLLAQICTGAVQSVGLDPYAGFLHEIVYNRPALGLDLMEEFRPVLDGIVLWCCNSGRINPLDFRPAEERPPDEVLDSEDNLPEEKQTREQKTAKKGIWLGESGKKRFLTAFEERFNRSFTHPLSGQKLLLRQCIHEQARQIRRNLENGEAEYCGMGFR